MLSCAEWAPVIPLVVYAAVTVAGVNPLSILVPFLLCEAAGILLYVVEIHSRFKRRGGRRS